MSDIYYDSVGSLIKAGSLYAKILHPSGGRVFSVVSEPDEEPITLDELKAWAHLDGTDEDTTLEEIIVAARQATEKYLGRAIIKQKIRMLMDYWPGRTVELPMPPLLSVSRVFTIDEDDTETTYSSDSYYLITEAIPGKLVIKASVSAPSNDTDREYAGYGIEYYAGYSDDPDDVPSAIKKGIALWAAALNSDRFIDTTKPPPEVRKMIDIFRMVGNFMR